jgi:hypothetical protein
MDIYLKSGNILYLILLALLAGAAAYFYYRKSALESPKKYIFPAIRFLSVFFILLLFLTPVLSFIAKENPDYKNIFLIDASRSLEIENRKNEEVKIIKDKATSNNQFYFFADGLLKQIEYSKIDSINSISSGNNYTNLFKTLTSLSAIPNISSVTILSDGNVNEGGNPVELAKSFNVPFSYILIGDTAQKKDVLVKNVYVNPTAFIDSKVSVKAEINAFKSNETIKVNLYEEDNLLESKTLSVNDKVNSYEVEFNISSGTEGIKKYKIEIPTVKDEITEKNNTDYFFVNYLNNKFKVLVFSGGPSADYSFLKEQLSAVNNFQMTYQTQKSASEFYEPSVNNFKDYDVILFSGFPVAQTNAALLNDIKSALDKYKIPLVYIESRNIDYTKLSLFNEKLPVSIINSSNNEVETQLKLITNPNSEFLKKTDLSQFNSSPAVFTNSSSYSAKPGAESFLINSKNSQPSLVVLNTGEINSAAFLFHGFYKLRLNKQNDFSGTFNKLLSTTLFTIATKDKKKIMEFELSKNIAGLGDEVILKARLKNFEDISLPAIKVKINSKDFSKEIELSKISADYFEAKFIPPNKGDYKLTADLLSNGSMIESENARLLVDENNFEFKKTNADRTILSELASSTNGKNFTASDKKDISRFLDSLNSSHSSLQAKQDFNLKFNPYFLSIVIFLLCFEWFLRKRNNLP